MALLEENAAVHRRLADSYASQVRRLETEVERLRDELRDANTCNVLFFIDGRDVSVAAVTNNTAEGLELFGRAEEMFRKNEAMLHKQGIFSASIPDVPVNQLHETPFGPGSGGRRSRT